MKNRNGTIILERVAKTTEMRAVAVRWWWCVGRWVGEVAWGGERVEGGRWDGEEGAGECVRGRERGVGAWSELRRGGVRCCRVGRAGKVAWPEPNTSSQADWSLVRSFPCRQQVATPRNDKRMRALRIGTQINKVGTGGVASRWSGEH